MADDDAPGDTKPVISGYAVANSVLHAFAVARNNDEARMFPTADAARDYRDAREARFNGGNADLIDPGDVYAVGFSSDADSLVAVIRRIR